MEFLFQQQLCLSLEPGSGHQLSYITVVHVKENQEWSGSQNHFAREIFACLFHSSPTSLKHSQGHSSRAGSVAHPPTFTDTEDRGMRLAQDAD